jgi:putative aldouronate transport system substrate-binding protein
MYMKPQKAILLLITVVLAVSLPFACMRSVENDQTSPASSSLQMDTLIAGDDTIDPFGKYDPPIELSFVRTIDEDTALNILPQTPGETIEDNRWLTAYSEKLGINITYDWIVNGGYESDAYRQKLNVTLASGNLPDVIPVGPTQLKQLTDSDMVADLTPYWDAYATDTLKEYYTAQGPGILGSSTFEGRLRGLTSFTDGFQDGIYIWIRVDWLKKLGLNPPKTMDDLLYIAEAFTTRDPDGNGVDDTYGFAVTKDLHTGVLGLEGFFSGYHAYPNIWVEDNSGRLIYGSTMPEMKEALQVLAQMYRSGQIDRDFAVKDLNQVAESLANGKIGIEFGAQWNSMYPLASSFHHDPDADWAGYPLVSVDDEPAYSPSKFGLDSIYYAVNADCEYPEALIKLLNTHIELCWGETGDFDYYYMPEANDSRGVWKYSPVIPSPPFKNLAAFEELEKARKNGALDQLKGEAAAIQRNMEAYEKGDMSQWGWAKIYGPNGVYRYGVEYMDNHLYMWDKFTGPPTPTMVEKMSALTQMEREVFVDIVIGAASIDAFDMFVNDWYQIGGGDITHEVNEWYAAQQ